MNKNSILGVVFAFLCSSVVLFVTSSTALTPRESYRVYLEGKSLGLIESKDDLENYIDRKEEELKETYQVDNVFIPNNLDIVKEITYSNGILSTEDIYNKIKEISPFTIKGYKITIKGTSEKAENQDTEEITPDVSINVLDQQVFIDAATGVISAFTTEEGYNKFINGKQEEIEDVGTIIEDIYIKNDIIVKETNVSTEDMIFTTSEDLKKYLLFGTTEDQDTYIVQDGDTIEEVAYNHKLSTGEFLIANPQFTNENNLLYENQEVNVGIIDPVIKVIEEDHTVSIETHRYETIYEDDPDLVIGYDYVKQEGIDGLDKITRKVQQVNGEVISAIPTATEELKPAVSQIIVRGQKQVSGVGNLKVWAWPTNRGYMISTGYEWRWGKFHDGLDIYGTGYGSPIYAANNGVVIRSQYDSTNGYYIVINHNNGYYTIYAHMSQLLVKAGQIVEMGQRIGSMGESGYAFGVHLHFGVWRGGYPYSSGAYSVNPWGLY